MNTTLKTLGMASAEAFFSKLGTAANEIKIIDTNKVSGYKGEVRHVFLTFLEASEDSPLKKQNFAAIPKTEMDAPANITNGYIKLVQSVDNATGEAKQPFYLFTKRGF